MTQWYRRLADVPQVHYRPAPDINRSRLSGHKASPEIHTYDDHGARRTYMMWPSLEETGTTSASPAKQWKSQPLKGETPGQTALRTLNEQLELPGTVDDYVSSIQNGLTSLWDQRRDEPWVYAVI